MPTITRQWHRNGVPISGATGLTYLLTSSDVGATMTCVETATNGGPTATATSNALGPVTALTPEPEDNGVLALFANGEQGLWIDPSDLSSMFTDDGITAVTTVGQAVYRINDKSGRGNHLRQADATKRPTYQLRDGKPCLRFTSDGMTTGSVDFTGTDEMLVIAGVRKEVDTATAAVVELGASSSTGTGSFALFAPLGSEVANFSFRSRGSVHTEATSPATFGAPRNAVLTGTTDISANSVVLRVNGAQAATSTSDQGTPTPFINASINVGARNNGASLFFAGDLFGLVVRGKLPTGAELTAAEAAITANTPTV